MSLPYIRFFYNKQEIPHNERQEAIQALSGRGIDITSLPTSGYSRAHYFPLGKEHSDSRAFHGPTQVRQLFKSLIPSPEHQTNS